MSYKIDRLQSRGRDKAGEPGGAFFKVCHGIRKRPLVIGLSLTLMLGTPVFAEDMVVPTTKGEPLTPFATDAQEGLELALDETVLQALQHNVSLAVQRYQRSSTLLGVSEAMGIYDLELTATLSTSSSNSPTRSVLEDADILTQDNDVWNFGFQQASPYGGGGSIDFNNSRFETTNEAIRPNPRFGANLDVGYRQPLLRNFGRDATERNIIVARTNSDINKESFRQQVESVVRQVSDTYWDLVEAKAQLAVSEESLALAKDLHRMNKIQVEVGTLAPLEMVQSEVGVATREEEIIRRRQAVGDTEDLIRRLVNFEMGPLWNLPLKPTTDPEIEHDDIDVPEAVKTAFAKRADVRQKELSNETNALDAKIARNLARPQLDLSAQYSLTSVAGTSETSDTGYSDALDQITGRDFDGWSIGFNFSMPLQNRAAKARATQANLLVEQNALELRDLKDQVMVEVRQAARAVESAAKSIESAKVSSKLAQKNLEAEQKRYENGLSTSFQVLEIQEDLSAARSREVTAVITYRKALTSFHLLTGQLLDQNGISLADD